MAKQCPGCPKLYNLHSLEPWEMSASYPGATEWEFCPRCKEAMVGHIGLPNPEHTRSEEDVLCLISND